MNSIEQAGEEMSLAYKQLEAAWKAAADRLLTAHCPYECAVVVGDSDEFAKLVWAKLKSKWHICIEDAAGELRPVTDAPVDLRLLAMDHFPALAAEVLKQTRLAVPQIRAVAERFLESLQAMETKPAPPDSRP